MFGHTMMLTKGKITTDRLNSCTYTQEIEIRDRVTVFKMFDFPHIFRIFSPTFSTPAF